MCLRKTRLMLLLLGGVSLSAAGCITGTNTFSSTAVPKTRFCNNDDPIEILSADLGLRQVVEPDFDRVSLKDE